MNITIQIPFALWAGKPALSIEIDASIEARFHLRAAVNKAISQGADLRSANLSGANLRSANLRSADSAELACAMTSITPEGTFIGWKKCNNSVIVAMLIPVAAKRCNATGRKCRAEYVEVLEVYGATEGITDQHGPKTVYRKGETVKCHEWDNDRFNECSGGIHFFLTRIEAETY